MMLIYKHMKKIPMPIPLTSVHGSISVLNSEMHFCKRGVDPRGNQHLRIEATLFLEREQKEVNAMLRTQHEAVRRDIGIFMYRYNYNIIYESHTYVYIYIYIHKVIYILPRIRCLQNIATPWGKVRVSNITRRSPFGSRIGFKGQTRHQATVLLIKLKLHLNICSTKI